MVFCTIADVYLPGAMAAQFESFVDPLVIMLSACHCPWWGRCWRCNGRNARSTCFARLADYPGGLITKHGILIVGFANQLREQGCKWLLPMLEWSAASPSACARS